MSKQGLVLYKSKYGATRCYAELLRETLDCVTAPIDTWNNWELTGYAWILYAGGIYAGGIGGLKTFAAHWTPTAGQKVAILAVGASPYEESAFQAVRDRAFQVLPEKLPIFYARGAWDESRMKLTDRLMCKLLQTSIQKRDPDTLEPWMLALLEARGQARDWTDRAYLTPLMEFLTA